MDPVHDHTLRAQGQNPRRRSPPQRNDRSSHPWTGSRSHVTRPRPESAPKVAPTAQRSIVGHPWTGSRSHVARPRPESAPKGRPHSATIDRRPSVDRFTITRCAPKARIRAGKSPPQRNDRSRRSWRGAGAGLAAAAGVVAAGTLRPGGWRRTTVRERGVEPLRPLGHGDLNPARLPVTPLPPLWTFGQSSRRARDEREGERDQEHGTGGGQTASSRRSFATCPAARTPYIAFSIRPPSSTTNVDRITPVTGLPYIIFSP